MLCGTAQAQYRIDQWTADGGLPQNSVYGIVQTRDGYLWLATVDGLARFDGVRFTVFNKGNTTGIVNNRFISLFEDARGDLWAGTEESGLARLHEGRFTNYFADEGAFMYVGDDGDGNAMTLLRGAKPVHFLNGEFVPFESQTTFPEEFRFVRPPNVRVMFGLLPGIFFGYQADGKPNETKPLPGAPEYKIVSAVRDGAGNFWLLTDERELVRVENGKTVRVYKKGDDLPGFPVMFVTGAKVSLISWDGQNSLILTDLETMRSETLLKTPENTTSVADDIYPPFLPKENPFLSSYQDTEGNIWLGTIRGGLYRARKQVITAFSTAAGLTENIVYPIYEDDDGALLVGTRRLYRFHDGRFASVEVPENLSIQAIGKEPAGRVVVSHFSNLYVRDETNRFVPYLEGLVPTAAEIYVIHTDREKRLWIGAGDGLYYFENGTATAAKKLTTENGLAGNDVKTIIEARGGGIWIGTYGGLSRFQNGQLTSWTETDGLPSRTIRALYEDADGVLWIGTYDGGLARFKDGKFTAYNSKTGLFTDQAFQILEDQERNFWISSNHGIYRVSKDELNEYADGKRQNIISIAYGKTDGMLNAEANGGRSPAGIKTRDGRLWFPTQDGVAMIDPQAVKANPKPPPVVIEAVRIDNQDSGFVNSDFGSEDKGESAIPNPRSQIKIAPSQQNFEITYTALSFINSENLRFKYKLEGLDDDWIDAGTRRAAYFSHIPPGEYTFRVIAANSDNVWNEQGAAIKIVIEPAFYQTWWFLTLAVLAIAAAVFLLYLRRIRKLETERLALADFSRRLINAHETERRRIAAELHDSIGQSLAMIKNSAVFGKQTIGSVAEAKEHLAEISGASAQAISEVREIAYNLRPFMLDRLGLTKAITSLLNKIADSSALKIVSEIENIDGVFESETEISVYRIVQECLNNIMKHSEAREVKVKIARIERGISIAISDDGKGFDVKNQAESKQNGGFGLIGMTERVRILGGTLAIDSAIGAGTTIEIEIWKVK